MPDTSQRTQVNEVTTESLPSLRRWGESVPFFFLKKTPGIFQRIYPFLASLGRDNSWGAEYLRGSYGKQARGAVERGLSIAARRGDIHIPMRCNSMFYTKECIQLFATILTKNAHVYNMNLILGASFRGIIHTKYHMV